MHRIMKLLVSTSLTLSARMRGQRPHFLARSRSQLRVQHASLY